MTWDAQGYIVPPPHRLRKTSLLGGLHYNR
jgi:hypothetical protein